MARHARPAPQRGRHRLSAPGRVHVRQYPGIAAILQTTARGWWRAPIRRHSWGWLHSSGGRPRSAFAIMLGL